MFHNKDVIRQIGMVAICELACVALMLAVYALLGRFDTKVLIGGLLGGGLAIANFLLLSMAVARAADQAMESGEAAKATLSIRSSAAFRLLAIAASLFLAFRAELCEPIAALLPLIFLQLCINLVGFFRKDKQSDKDGEITK